MRSNSLLECIAFTKSPDGLWRIGAGEGSWVGLAEALREVVGAGFGHDFGFLEGALFTFLDQQALVIGAAHGQVDGFVLPGAEENGVRQLDAVNALVGGREELFTFADGVGEVLQDLHMLATGLSDGDFHVPGFRHGKGGFGFHAELAHGLAIPLEVNFAAVGDGEATLFARDFQLVHARGLAGGGDKGGGGAVVVLQHSGHVVLDFDLMEAAELAETTDFLRHTKHPLEEVEIVWALVHENAAALPFPRAAPAAGGVVVVGAEPISDFPMDATHGAKLAAVDEVLHLFKAGVGAHVEHGRKDFGFVRVRRDEPFAVGFMNGNGFFHEDVQPSA